MPRRISPRIVGVSPAERPLTLRVRWASNDETVIDLADLIADFRIFAPLRDSAELFRSVRVGEYGTDIVWSDEIDMAADSLWRLAQEQSGATITADAF